VAKKMKNDFENLKMILEQQIAFAQADRIDKVEELFEQANEEIASFADIRKVPENIRKLYNELCLILKTNMMDIKTALKNSKKNKLAARIYRRNS
jgi:hypothetical protein